MQAFTITSNEGKTTHVDAPNWMVAMGQAIAYFQEEDGLDAGVMARWICSPGEDGSAFVDDPITRRSWMVRKTPPAPKLQVRASAASVAEHDRLSREEDVHDRARREDDDDLSGLGPPPTLVMPTRSTLVKEEQPETLAEQMFELSFDMAGESPNIAAGMALELLQRFIKCEAASIVRGTLNDPQLKFLAASGPVGEQLVGKTMQFGKGLIGVSYDSKVIIVVSDVRNDDRHFSAFDERTGFNTEAVLCAPIVDDGGQCYGVIQIINPHGGFREWHLECAENVGRTLSGTFAT